jgi:hypothetical protein
LILTARPLKSLDLRGLSVFLGGIRDQDSKSGR